MKKLTALLLALVMVASIAACGKDPATTPLDGATTPEVIKDSHGNEFTIPCEMNRIIVLNSSVYEMICVLGKSDSVIGVSDTTVAPASALTKEKFGGWKEPNVEMILEAAPDAVMGYASWLDSGIASQITDAGIPVVMLDLYVPSEIPAEVEFLGKLLGAQERANAFLADIAEVHALVDERCANVEPVSVFWEGYTDYKSVGNGSGGHQLMELAHVNSLTAGADTAYPEISDEWLVESNPGMIVKLVSSTKGIMGETITDPAAVKEVYDGVVSRPGWDSVDAVTNGKVLILYSRIATTPLGLAIAPLYIAATAYPEKFSDVNPDETLKELLNTYWGEDFVGIWTYTGK